MCDRIKNMKKLQLLMPVIFLLTSSCANIFEAAGNKNTDAARYEEAQKLLNEEDYDGAIEKFDLLSDSFMSKSKVRKAYASALAGKCGLNFINYFDSLGNAGSGALFKFFMNAFTGKTISPNHCKLAQAQMELISDSRALTDGEKIFVAILGMAKIGAYIRNKADVDGTGSLGDGTMDATFKVCKHTDDANHLTDSEMKEIITGFGMILINIAALGDDSPSGLGSLSQACTDSGITPNPCEITDVDSVSAQAISFFRLLLKSSVVGIGSCATPVSDPTFIACCPGADI